MVKETMNIRAAIKEKKLLDDRIEKLCRTMSHIGFYANSNPMVNDVYAPAAFADKLKADMQSLNDMVKRREAINVAIIHKNANTIIEVPAFVSFISDAPAAKEEISLAAAINRKNYYKGVVLNMIQNMISKANMELSNRNKFANEMAKKAENNYTRRASAVQNLSPAAAKEIEEDERNKAEVNLINPNNVIELYPDILKSVEDYILNIDNSLSRATEITMIDIEY